MITVALKPTAIKNQQLWLHRFIINQYAVYFQHNPERIGYCMKAKSIDVWLQNGKSTLLSIKPLSSHWYIEPANVSGIKFVYAIKHEIWY